MKMKTIVKHIQFRFYFIDYSYKSSRNKERFGVNASCMLYSLKIVFTMRQGLLTSAVSVLMTTFNAIQANIAVDEMSLLMNFALRSQFHVFLLWVYLYP